jgi:hypothetical protein
MSAGPGAAPTTLEIHPSIGISRVGTSDQFFLGPEPGVDPPAAYRDPSGKLLRQAARFRVFQCERDAQGRLVRATEVDPRHARVEWTVHLANRKADGPVFPPRPSRRGQQGVRRNARHTNRADLVIDPGPRTVQGPNQVAAFDTGRFLGKSVPLGEARTDDHGRLLVVGGFGTSDGPAADLTTFANNDNWHDDVSDGPVTASVTLAGQHEAVQAEPAWVVVTPPDFAPQVVNFVTLYDVAFQVAVARGWRTLPERPSFSRDILPILSRAVGYAWVIELARMVHAPGGPGDFLEKNRLAQLADPAGPQALRQTVLERLRDPSHADQPVTPGSMPRLHDETNTERVLMPTSAQYDALQKWVAGTFVNDLGKKAPVELVPDALDRAALEACTGGPFFPGIEAGRVLRDPDGYVAPFRLDASRHQPGDVTQGNAVPWQADFLLCRFENRPELGWWPAQRPDAILTSPTATAVRLWARGITTFADMVNHWHELGVVVPTPGADGRPVFVESERLLPDA